MSVDPATRKTIDVSVSVHKTVPVCCRSTLLDFAAVDLYRGTGEPGDQIRCACGSTLVYDHRGWRVLA